jgi:hypothetical protein
LCVAELDGRRRVQVKRRGRCVRDDRVAVEEQEPAVIGVIERKAAGERRRHAE